MTVFYEDGVEAGIRLIEQEWFVLAERHFGKLSEAMNRTQNESPCVRCAEPEDEEVLTWPPAPMLRDRSLESEQAIQPFRRLSTCAEADSDTFRFNANNSPIPRGRLGPQTSWEESVRIINTHLNCFTEELAQSMLGSMDAKAVSQIAEVFRDEGTDNGIAYLDQLWNRWMSGWRSPVHSVLDAPISDQSTAQLSSLPLFGLPLTSSPEYINATLPIEHMQTPAQAVETRPLYDQQGGDAFYAPVNPTNPDYVHYLAMRSRAESIARWVASSGRPDWARNGYANPDHTSDDCPGSWTLDFIERGRERGLDAISEAFSTATAGHEPQNAPVWSLPGIQGLPPHLSTQGRIWGM
ncbi:hypothetical protein BDY19DRAFT_968878 [Irpex rosettiformis]|uniref:Uncharacterized protein n=1 Tax=Irpex rosettiformis TaxID=378272 RepID=A0ACB8TSU5_9APHY|nr:hypothetical protein BDY19DRAFT_968878 [Irpex rosettiformis]